MLRRDFVVTFATEEDVLGAVRAARAHGLSIADVYTPYPVHGLDQAMGLRPSRLPWICFMAGVLGTAFALWFQHWTMASDWPMNVGGKPWNSLPAYVPIVFETLVVWAGLTVVAAFLLRCRLFPGKRPSPRFPGATNNRFVVVLDRLNDPIDANLARNLFADFHAVTAETAEEPSVEPMSRRGLNRVLFLAFLGSLALYVVLGRDYTQRNFEVLPEMVHSPAYDTYAPNTNFPDGKTLQPPEPGTIPRGRLPLHFGSSPEEAIRAGAELPNPIPLNDVRARRRGAFLFTNYCVMCHGKEGKGDGLMAQRGVPLASSLLAENALEMKDGQMFHILTYGQKTMAAQAAQLSREDRWKVIVYVRWLQKQAAGAKRP
jgi:mono/diheme cytochrome c family protein